MADCYLGACLLSEVPLLLTYKNPLHFYGEHGKNGSSDTDSQSLDTSQFQAQLSFLGSVLVQEVQGGHRLLTSIQVVLGCTQAN